MEKFIHALWHLPNMDYRKFFLLSKAFESFQYVWEKASYQELEKAGLTSQFSENLFTLRKKLDVDQAFAKLSSYAIEAIAITSEAYPLILKQIGSPPFMIYCKGNKEALKRKALAVVGTRKSTTYGENFTRKLVSEIVQYNIVIVSGLAFGIDSIAHKTCVEYKKPTIAVLASGIAHITPSSHTRLAQNILHSGGAIISEYPLTSPAFKQRFIERNRIISGLAQTTVIVEAQERSGSLITARHALEQNRNVFALPGDIHKLQSKGCNQLIRRGEAQILSHIEDIFMDFGIHNSPSLNKIPAKLDQGEKMIIEKLQKRNQSVDELLQSSKLTLPEIQIALSNLEISGSIRKNSQLEWELCGGI